VKVLCGVGDGGGKICGRSIQHFDEAGGFVIGMCTKHAFVAVVKTRFDQAEAAGQEAVHLVRRKDADVANMFKAVHENVAHRSPEG